MKDKEFVNSLIAKAPHENAPDFVKADISIKREELIEWLSNKEGDWVNINIKESQGGKWYAEVNSWKPQEQPGGQEERNDQPHEGGASSQGDEFEDDDIPF